MNKAAAAGSALHTRSRCRTHWLHSLMVQVSRMHQVAQRMCDSPPTCSRWPYLAIEHPTSTWHRIAAGKLQARARRCTGGVSRSRKAFPLAASRDMPCARTIVSWSGSQRVLTKFPGRPLRFRAHALHSASCQSQQQIWRSLAPRCLRYGTPVVAYYRHESSCLGTALGCVMGFH